MRLMVEGQPAVIVLGARGAGGWTDATGVTAWRDAAWDAFRTLCNGGVTCTGATGRDVSGPLAPVFDVGAPPLNIAGTRTGTLTLGAGCYLVKWVTATGGRSGKGRTFVPGLLAADLGPDGRKYTLNTFGLVDTAVKNYRDGLAAKAVGLTPAILSFRRGAAFDITGGSLSSIPGVQRRRMRA